MAIELPALPYAPSALAPHLSAATLELHHGGHHRGYVEQTNRLLEGSGLEDLPLEQIVRRARGRLAEQAAQAWNHGFYWTCLAPRGGGEPDGRLGELLARQYGDFAHFREEGVALVPREGEGVSHYMDELAQRSPFAKPVALAAGKG